MSKPTQKQIDFATTISEWVAVDLPQEMTKDSLWEYINEHCEEFYKLQNEERYRTGRLFTMEHAYHFGDYMYDRINKNPETV